MRLRGRRGTCGTGLALALVAGDTAVFCVVGVALGTSRGIWRGKRGILGEIDLAFAWQAWHLWHWAGSCDALGPCWSPVTPRFFFVAAVALGDIQRHLAWHPWHLVRSAVCLRGRRGWHWAGSLYRYLKAISAGVGSFLIASLSAIFIGLSAFPGR